MSQCTLVRSFGNKFAEVSRAKTMHRPELDLSNFAPNTRGSGNQTCLTRVNGGESERSVAHRARVVQKLYCGHAHETLYDRQNSRQVARIVLILFRGSVIVVEEGEKRKPVR